MECGFVRPLDHIGRNLHTVHGDALEKRGGARCFESLGLRYLLVHRELHGELAGGFAVHMLVSDADRRDVRIIEVVGALGADELSQSDGEFIPLGAGCAIRRPERVRRPRLRPTAATVRVAYSFSGLRSASSGVLEFEMTHHPICVE